MLHVRHSLYVLLFGGQDKIWKRLNEANRHSEPQDAANHHEEESDETLKRTGRLECIPLMFDSNDLNRQTRDI